jgi:hypothetical protein
VSHYAIAPVPWPLISLSRQVTVVITADRETGKVTELIEALVLRGSLYLMAGSDWIPAYALARSIRRKTLRVKEILDGLRLARAFTCYQMRALLESAPPDRDPLLVLDIMNTFFDQDIPVETRLRVFGQCCQYLQRLAVYRPVAVLAQPKLPASDYEQFYALLAAITSQVVHVGAASGQVMQPALF